MYRTFLSFFLIIISLPVFAGTRTVVTQTPAFNPYYVPQAYYGGDYIPNKMYNKKCSVFSDINELERYALNKNFNRDSDLIRLERLEKLAFGAIQKGDIYTRYDNVRDAILTRPKINYKTSLLRNISDYFNGHVTGFTPTVTQYGSDDNFYGKNSATEYISPWGKGYRVDNYGIGTGMGVKMLD